MEMRFTSAVSKFEKLISSLVMQSTEIPLTAHKDLRKRLRHHYVEFTSE